MEKNKSLELSEIVNDILAKIRQDKRYWEGDFNTPNSE